MNYLYITTPYLKNKFYTNIDEVDNEGGFIIFNESFHLNYNCESKKVIYSKEGYKLLSYIHNLNEPGNIMRYNNQTYFYKMWPGREFEMYLLTQNNIIRVFNYDLKINENLYVRDNGEIQIFQFNVNNIVIKIIDIESPTNIQIKSVNNLRNNSFEEKCLKYTH